MACKTLEEQLFSFADAGRLIISIQNVNSRLIPVGFENPFTLSMSHSLSFPLD
jgi:hypothetical protein